jgi:hypothetical protein
MKPNDALNSNFIGITFLYVSGSLSARLLPGTGWNCSSILFLVANGHQICKNVPMLMYG